MKEWKNPELTNLGVESTKEKHLENKGLLRCECCGEDFGNIIKQENIDALIAHRQTVHGNNIGDPCPIS